MKQKLLLKAMLLLCALVAGSSSVWAVEKTYTYVFTTKDWNATLGGKSANWSSGQDGGGFSNNGVQVTTSATGANATSPRSFNNISKIVVTYNTNKSKGAGTLDIKIGSNDAVSKDWAYSGTSDGTSANFTLQYDYDTKQSGNVKITANTTTNSIYVVSIAITTDNPTHALTYSATNGSITVTDADKNSISSGSQVEQGEILNISASGNPGYVFDSWSLTGSGSSVTDATSASTTFTMGSADASLSASFIQDVTEYDITCNATTNGSVEPSVTKALLGTVITLTTTPSFRYHTKNISVKDAGDNDVEVTKIAVNKYTFSMPSSDVTVDATFDNNYTDVLNKGFTGLTGTGYTDWTGKKDNSAAVYAGNSGGDKNSIQLRSTNNSGIITTASGGYVRKVTVTWQSDTQTGRTVNVYGKNTPYSSSADLSNANNKGTLLGTIVKGTSTELTVTGDYQFIGLCSASNALYLEEIDIKWEETTTAKLNIAAACTDGEGNYYGTYSNGNAFVVPSGLTVSAVSVTEGKLVVTDYAEGDVVKANTGVMVSATSAGDKTITLSAETGTEKAGNLLKPSGDAGITAANMNVADTKFYRLTMHNGTDIGFWWGAADGAAFDLAANKAYLAVPTGAGAPSMLWFDNGSTGVDEVKGKMEEVRGDFFDLQGRKVANPTKGLYIVNGKKVVIK